MEGDGNGGGDYREEEALLLKALSETKYKSRDIPSALKYARRAFRVFPSLPGIQSLLSSLRILSRAAESSPAPDYYGILQLDPFSDVESVRRQYKTLALAIQPDKNPSFVSQDAFKAVGEALRVLSDGDEKERYDLSLRVRLREEGLGVGGDVGLGSEGRFWSRCGECGKLHEFEKAYMGKKLVCSGCGKSFKAVGVTDAGDGVDSDSMESDEEDPGIAVETGSLPEDHDGGDDVFKVPDIIYVRKRRRGANKSGESGTVGKQTGADSGVTVVGAKKVKREGTRASVGSDKGIKAGLETDEEEEEEERFWGLKLKHGFKKGKTVETSGGSVSDPEDSVEVDGRKNYEKEVRSHVVSGLKVRSRNARRKAKPGKKHNAKDVEVKKTVVVMGLRYMTEEDRLRLGRFSDKGHSEVHQSPKADVVSGSNEWGGSRRRSLRVMVKSAEESALVLYKKSNASGEEAMTLAEMQSRLIEKLNGDRRRTSNQKKKMEKEKGMEKAGPNQAYGADGNEDERVAEQMREDGVKELWNDEKDSVNENESVRDDKGETDKEEEEPICGEEEKETAKMSDKEDEGDKQPDQENENEEDEREMRVVLLESKQCEDEKGEGEDQVGATATVPINADGIADHGTWGNGDEVEETTTDTRWAKRIRCYETKRRALLKRNKDLGAEILETGPPDLQSGSVIIEMPIVTKSRSLRHTMSSNSDFYNFNKDRGERNFKTGQVWAIYDEFGLPRQYGLIDEVMSINPFAVGLKLLAKQDMNGQDPAAPCSACGRFKETTTTTVELLGIFSHEVDGDKVARETYDIFPKKDSVWAIYGGGLKNERYDIVVCLTSYIDMFGLSLAYLEKVDGFRTVYKRKEFGWHAVRWLGKEEVSLLSHQVPARRLSHEDGSDFEEDCWVLDPASIPPSPVV
ncbi:hypothetical protein MLD38_038987 [Melastoma candidum]|uniref:Uncharacterized protein n=1 Tax=Melastoma candidum TaxID=119954 RepID=A0ACB9L0X8_9MYRT|nr:hypothetical protein MLD38_038987 [Melastoma candidum]